jgi:hypothetical protein
MAVQPSTVQKVAINRAIGRMKAEQGVWAALDGFQALHSHDHAAALINWKSPGTYDCTESGTVTFTAYSGIAGNGVNGFLNTNFNPVTAASPHFTKDSQCMFLWSLKSGTDAGGACGQLTAGNNYIYPRYTDDHCYAKANNTADHDVAGITDGTGFYSVNRSASSATKAYKNGAVISTQTFASLTLNSSNLVFLRDNTGFWSGGLAIIGWGGSLGDAAQAALYDIVSELRTSFFP